ncbi:DNA repair protein RadC [Commensalibacter communis]|nr:DNA repair protein RadC [Commensalibacter communis]CAI3948222.1 DNA repair protein RadC [Commensalibacter communis]CAI3949059.1 DNA repair protein RadC [Commensalibacter communis]CAI3949252.1 DNA repair protein RadC [Commensalibacter communis]CAI3949549.1 DNA repair protein RadC [Commensalibacter communis]
MIFDIFGIITVNISKVIWIQRVTRNENPFYIKSEHKIKSKEKHAFSDKELLEELSRWIRVNKNVPDWPNSILSRFGSLPAMLLASKDELQNGLELSEKESANIKLFHEVCIRLLKGKIYNCDILKNKYMLINYLIAHLSRKQTECFYIYFLDHKGVVLQESLQGIGTVNTTSLYIREVTKSALQCNASQIIMVHNHPTGVAKPSEVDIKLTEMVVHALKVVDIKVVDHLIIGNGCYFSFEENSLITPSNINPAT